MFLADRAVVGGVLGLAVGSFLNVVIHRVPRGETPWRPARSYCPACQTPIRARDNVPVASYLWLRGRCRACGTRISPRYPAVEAATGVLFAAAFATTADSTVLLDALAFGTFLLTLGVVDAETRRLPDSLVGIGGVVALAIRVWASFTAGSMAQASDAVVAGVVGYVVLSLVRWLGGLAFRREAMGRGDPTFLGAIGFFLADWRLVLLTIGLSAIVGSVVGGMLIAARRGRATTAIPYGPFLALGAGIARLWGGRLMEFYLNGYG